MFLLDSGDSIIRASIIRQPDLKKIHITILLPESIFPITTEHSHT